MSHRYRKRSGISGICKHSGISPDITEDITEHEAEHVHGPAVTTSVSSGDSSGLQFLGISDSRQAACCKKYRLDNVVHMLWAAGHRADLQCGCHAQEVAGQHKLRIKAKVICLGSWCMSS